MPKYQNPDPIISAMVETSSSQDSLQNQISDQINLAKDEQPSNQHPAIPILALAQFSGPAQWPLVHWFLVQGQWATGPNQ